MAAKSKTLVKLKPIVGRNEDRSIVNVAKKILPRVSNDQSLIKQSSFDIAEFNRLIIGDFTQDFSKQTSRLFRIFISSTFSDFKVERNELYRRVFPLIKQKCAQLGYEFQVVDMRYDYLFDILITIFQYSMIDGVFQIQLIVIIQLI